uniref:Uncharacterized protein n=1 Tax=Vitis vinifera TaxID=29760 RepID=A5B7Z0_VITVI|nr:hypothetical protein VITISV_015531 [Vitis vinifera]
MEIPHEDQSSHYDHEKDKFAYLSMRDRIELGKRQAQQSQWGSKYALNEDMSMKAKLASMVRRIEEFELRNVHTEAQPQAMPTSFEYINHPNLTTQPQPQPSMSTSSLEQAILKISKVMEDFVGEQQKINSHLNEKIDNMESSINTRMEGVYNDLSLRIEKVQDSIEKFTNLDIARGKRKLPPQPHHNLQGTNAKRSRKVLKIDTLVGDCYDNSMDQPSIENHKVQDDKGLLEPFKASTSLGKRRKTNSLGPNGKDANFVWDPGGIQHEVGGNAKMMKEKEEKREFWPLVLLPLWDIFWSTSSSPFHAYYISFRSLGSQESNNSNGVQIGVETKKLWSLQENWTELSGNFAHLNPRCETPPGTRVPFRTPQAHFHTVRNKVRKFRTPLFKVRNSFQGAKISVQGASISHTSIEGAKNFRTVRNHLLAHECHFAHLKPIFTPCETRCENLSSRCINFAHHNSRCEIHSNVRIRKLWPFEDDYAKLKGNVAAAPNFATVRHIFEALSGAQIMHTIYYFEAWEVRNPVLQMVHDLDLKRRSYGRFKTDGSQESNVSNRVRFGAEMRKIWPSEDNCIKLRDNFARWKSRCEIPQSKVWEFRTPQTKSRCHTRRASATPVAPTQISPRGPPTKKAKTSELGESSRAPRDSQSQPPSTRHPRPSSPIKGNSDCRSRAFHVEAYFDHIVLRQQTELRDSYRLLERYHLVPFMTLPQFFYPRVALDFYQSMTTRGVPRRGAVLEALFRISEGYYFGPHHLIMAALLHFEEKVHKRRLTRAASIQLLFPRLLCHVLAHMGFPADPHSEPRRHCRESFSLEQWNQVWLHQHSPELPEPRAVPPAPSTSAPAEPVPEAASSDAPPAVPPTSEPPITIPGAEYRALLASFQTLTTTQTAIMERMDHFQLQ